MFGRLCRHCVWSCSRGALALAVFTHRPHNPPRFGFPTRGLSGGWQPGSILMFASSARRLPLPWALPSGGWRPFALLSESHLGVAPRSVRGLAVFFSLHSTIPEIFETPVQESQNLSEINVALFFRCTLNSIGTNPALGERILSIRCSLLGSDWVCVMTSRATSFVVGLSLE